MIPRPLSLNNRQHKQQQHDQRRWQHCKQQWQCKQRGRWQWRGWRKPDVSKDGRCHQEGSCRCHQEGRSQDNGGGRHRHQLPPAQEEKAECDWPGCELLLDHDPQGGHGQPLFQGVQEHDWCGVPWRRRAPRVWKTRDVARSWGEGSSSQVEGIWMPLLRQASNCPRHHCGHRTLHRVRGHHGQHAPSRGDRHWWLPPRSPSSHPSWPGMHWSPKDLLLVNSDQQWGLLGGLKPRTVQ